MSVAWYLASLATSASFGAAALLMLYSGVLHLARPGDLRAVLVTQRVLPFRWTRPAARTLLVAQLTIGFSAVGSLATVPVSEVAGYAVCATAALTGTLYSGFVVYLTVALRRAPRARCGCFAGGETLGYYVVARAGFLAIAAAYTASAAGVGDLNFAPIGVPYVMGGALLLAIGLARPAFLKRASSKWLPARGS